VPHVRAAAPPARAESSERRACGVPCYDSSHMIRYVVVGNSSSGKSTLAMRLAREGVAHLDLDTLAWEPAMPPRRRPLGDSGREIASFMDANEHWIIEGCYADLLEGALSRCTRLVFLNPGIETCVANARARPWEPHKYPSKAAQDANLEMLIGWIRDYAKRDDVCSLAAHRALFDGFSGPKIELRSPDELSV
jgi:adenylate kinase family enzyme